MRLPTGWTTVPASGARTHSLIHTPCGFQSHLGYDLTRPGPFGQAAARLVVATHTCNPTN